MNCLFFLQSEWYWGKKDVARKQFHSKKALDFWNFRIWALKQSDIIYLLLWGIIVVHTDHSHFLHHRHAESNFLLRVQMKLLFLSARLVISTPALCWHNVPGSKCKSEKWNGWLFVFKITGFHCLELSVSYCWLLIKRWSPTFKDVK